MDSQTAIGTYLLPEERSELDERAANLGISRSKLLTVFFLDQLGAKRVGSLRHDYQKKVDKKDGIWVEAKFHNAVVVEAFQLISEEAGLSKTVAAGVVIRAGLKGPLSAV